MPYLKIMPGVGSLSSAGHFLSGVDLKPGEDIAAKVFARDGHACRYCGFQARKYQELNYIGPGGSATPVSIDSYATACVFCHQCFNLDRIERMQSGVLIWLPEIAQAELHHICRAIYVARISQGVMADAARDALEALVARRAEARARLGTDSPRILATVMQDFLEAGEYKNRETRLGGFRVLPLDRRVIREGDLEFNQFPQMLAYWRSKEGPFGDMPPRSWARIFYELKAKTAPAAA